MLCWLGHHPFVSRFLLLTRLFDRPTSYTCDRDVIESYATGSRYITLVRSAEWLTVCCICICITPDRPPAIIELRKEEKRSQETHLKDDEHDHPNWLL